MNKVDPIRNDSTDKTQVACKDDTMPPAYTSASQDLSGVTGSGPPPYPSTAWCTPHSPSSGLPVPADPERMYVVCTVNLPSTGRHQPQQQVVILSANPNQVPVSIQTVESFEFQMLFSCFVSWCCNPLFGLIAFILAGVASMSAVSNPVSARQLGRASYGVAISGIIVTLAIIIIWVAVAASSPTSRCSYQYSYTYNDECYQYGIYSSRDVCCGTYDSYTGLCYSNSHDNCVRTSTTTISTTTTNCPYTFRGECYKHKIRAFSSRWCRRGVFDEHNKYCYYNSSQKLGDK